MTCLEHLPKRIRRNFPSNFDNGLCFHNAAPASFLPIPPLFHSACVEIVKPDRQSKGFLKGKTLLDKNLTFWTMSLWTSDAEMRAYRNTDAHKKAMPKLQRWCDEASIVHWLQDDAEFPSWDESHKRMLAEGRSSKVKRPSDDHVNFRIPSPRYPSKTERILLPKK
jgi:quinol monooxygenase YgiN